MYYAFINSVLAGRAAEAFCWMLVHSLWQGLLFTIITGIVMMATKKSTSLLRYNIMVALFVLFIAGCTATFTWQLLAVSQPNINQQIVAATITESSMHIMLQKFSAYFTANAPLILALWGIIFLVKCVRMMAGVAYSQRVRHYKTQPAPQYWQNKVSGLCMQLKLNKQVMLLQSGIVKIPVVIGHLKPVIFIPLGLLNNLPAGEIEAVLLHELAHIRRSDYFINLLQVMVENVFFFNPALLWMSAIIREERENCCDDVAVAHTQSKKQFIQALISFKEHALHTSNYATAFPAKKNQLLLRVTRIISNTNKTLNATEKAFFAASFILLAGLTIIVTKSIGTAKASPQKIIRTEPITTAAQVLQDKTTLAEDRKQPSGNKADLAAKETRHSQTTISYIAYQQEAKEPAEPNGPAEGNSIVKTALFEEPAKEQQEEPKNNQDDLDRLQAERDRMQADADRKQAERDRAQAELDRQQAMKDQEQAKIDQQQAIRDREQAERDRHQAELDRIAAEKDRQEAMKQTPVKPIPPVKAVKA